MSSNSVDVNDLVNAVGEDSNLSPAEKETTVGFTKDGSPTTAATQFDHHVASIYTEEAGIARRLLNHPHFSPFEVRVGELGNGVAYVEPGNFCGGQVTAVGGHIPIGTLKVGASVRSTPGHAALVAYLGSAANNSQSPSASSSGGVTEERVPMDNTDDSDEESEYTINDTLAW